MPKAAKKSGEAPTGSVKGSDAQGKKSVSKSQRAGLTFPVARINRFMKCNSGMKRIGGSAPVYMTAVIEYMTAEIMQLAGNAALGQGRKTVTPDDLTGALRSDADFAKAFAGHGIFVGDKLDKISETIKYTPASKSKKAATED